jgi:hypothetical protein
MVPQYRTYTIWCMAISKWLIDKWQSGPVRLFVLELGFENKRAKTPAGLLVFGIVTVTLSANAPVVTVTLIGYNAAERSGLLRASS